MLTARRNASAIYLKSIAITIALLFASICLLGCQSKSNSLLSSYSEYMITLGENGKYSETCNLYEDRIAASLDPSISLPFYIKHGEKSYKDLDYSKIDDFDQALSAIYEKHPEIQQEVLSDKVEMLNYYLTNKSTDQTKWIEQALSKARTRKGFDRLNVPTDDLLSLAKLCHANFHIKPDSASVDFLASVIHLASSSNDRSDPKIIQEFKSIAEHKPTGSDLAHAEERESWELLDSYLSDKQHTILHLESAAAMAQKAADEAKSKPQGGDSASTGSKKEEIPPSVKKLIHTLYNYFVVDQYWDTQYTYYSNWSSTRLEYMGYYEQLRFLDDDELAAIGRYFLTHEFYDQYSLYGNYAGTMRKIAINSLAFKEHYKDKDLILDNIKDIKWVALFLWIQGIESECSQNEYEITIRDIWNKLISDPESDPVGRGVVTGLFDTFLSKASDFSTQQDILCNNNPKPCVERAYLIYQNGSRHPEVQDATIKYFKEARSKLVGRESKVEKKDEAK